MKKKYILMETIVAVLLLFFIMWFIEKASYIIWICVAYNFFLGIIPIMFYRDGDEPLERMGFCRTHLLKQIWMGVLLSAVLFVIFVFIPVSMGAPLSRMLSGGIDSRKVVFFFSFLNCWSDLGRKLFFVDI